MAARAEAKDIRQRVDRGEDPAGDRRARREAPTLLELAERYKAEHLPRKVPQSRHDDGVMVGHILRHIGADAKSPMFTTATLSPCIGPSPTVAIRCSPTAPCRVRRGCSRWPCKPMAGENKPWRDQAQGNPCKGIERNPELPRSGF